MDRIFNMDNKFFVFMGRVADLILLNLYFVVSCIPIITIGPALTALHYITMKMAKNEESYIFRGYVKSFKENFKQGVIIHLIMSVTAILLFLDMRLVNNMTGNIARVLYCLFLAIGVLYFMIWLYIYPILAKFYNTIRNTFTNAFLMSIRHLPYTILMGLITIAPIAMLFLPSAQLVNYLILIFILCGFSLIAFCNAFLLVRIFSNYIPKEEEETGTEELFPELDDAAQEQILPELDQAALDQAAPEQAIQKPSDTDMEQSLPESGHTAPEEEHSGIR